MMNKITIIKAVLTIIIAVLSVFNSYAQKQTLSGIITDKADGNTLIGVSVVVKGTTNGIVSNVEGKYSITASKGDILTFSFLGYKAREITVSNQKELNVSLEASIELLDELMVVGYGSQKKSDLTGAISSISGEKLAIRPVSSVGQALQAQAAGVQVTNSSGMPGSQPSIRIRGHGSLNTTNGPLWVVDGSIVVDVNSVSVEDIANIEILKDASSTAIYGAKGGNGVILVTTKRGKKNENRVNFSYYHQISDVTKHIDLLNRSEFMTLHNQARTNAGFPEMFTTGQIDGSEATNGYIADTDWQGEVFSPAQADYFNLSLSGGSEKTTYALSINHRMEDGIIKPSDFKRSGIHLNLDHELSSKFRLGLTTTAYRTEGNSFDVSTDWNLGAAGGALTAYPFYPVYDSTGKYFNLSSWDNPLLAAEGQHDNRITNSLLGNLFLTYEVIKNLTLKADFSGDFRNDQRNTFVTAQLFGATNTRAKANASITDAYFTNWTGTLSATYDKKIGENQTLKLFAAVEQRVSDYNGNTMQSEEIDRESFLWYNMAAFNQANHVITNGNSGSVFQSVFGRLDYNLLDKYLFEATVRRDGSSRFGPADKWGTFPSASLAWKLSEEEFIKNLNLFDQLKIRGSWGITGNDNIDLYQWLSTITVGDGYSSAIFGNPGGSGGDKAYVGSEISGIPNESIHWEQSESVDLGVDMGFLNNRLRLTVDLYNRTTSELLYRYPIPLYTGYGDGWGGGATVMSNVAKMNNKGVELNLGADIISTNDFKWTFNFNLSKNVNKVVDLANAEPFDAGKTKIQKGKSIGNIWGYMTDGIFQEGDDIAHTPRFNGDEGVGDQRYKDANDNGILTDQDMGIIGNALPNFIFGVVNTFSYKDFELNTIINGVEGADMYNGTRQTLSNGSLNATNGGDWLLNSWTPENTATNIPRLTNTYVDKFSDRFIEDASFIRISNIQLSYNLPRRIASKFKMSSLCVYASLQNWFTITNYTGYDPEMHSGGDSNLDLGFDKYNYPSTKGSTFGIKVGF